MRNIRKPVVRILLNTLSYQDVGLYNDYNTKKKVMTFKKLGIQIFGDAATGTKAIPAVPAITNTLATGLTVAKSTTASGSMQMLFMSIEPPAPCETCNWDYGISIREKVKLPGVHSNRANVSTISYGDTMATVATSGGYITDAYQLLAENDIITQIANNLGKHIAEQRYPMKMTGSAVEARRAYKCTITNAANEITIKDSTGTAYGADVVTGASGKLAAEAINDAAHLHGNVMAFPANQTTSFYVMSAVNGEIFTVEDGGGTGTLTIDERYIVFLSKDDEIQFDVIVGKELGATFMKTSLYTLDGNTGAGTTTIYVDGVSNDGAADAADLEDYATELNSHFTGAGITDCWACSDPDNGVVYVWAGPTAQVLTFVFSATSTTSVTNSFSGYPNYPQLTSEDVFRMFWNNMDGGHLAAMQYGDQPLKDTDYNVYYIRNENLKITSLHGAGYNQTGEAEYEIYVPKSICGTSYWQANVNGAYSYMSAPTTANTSFETLLGILVGVLPSTW